MKGAAALHAGQRLVKDVEVLQHHTCASSNAAHWLLSNIDLHFRLFAESLREPLQECTATGHRYTMFHQVRYQLGRGFVNGLAYRVHDNVNRVAHSFTQ